MVLLSPLRLARCDSAAARDTTIDFTGLSPTSTDAGAIRRKTQWLRRRSCRASWRSTTGLTPARRATKPLSPPSRLMSIRFRCAGSVPIDLWAAETLSGAQLQQDRGRPRCQQVGRCCLAALSSVPSKVEFTINSPALRHTGCRRDCRSRFSRRVLLTGPTGVGRNRGVIWGLRCEFIDSGGKATPPEGGSAGAPVPPVLFASRPAGCGASAHRPESAIRVGAELISTNGVHRPVACYSVGERWHPGAGVDPVNGLNADGNYL